MSIEGAYPKSTYQYPSRYRFKTGLIVEFTSNGHGTVIDPGSEHFHIGDSDVGWSGPEYNDNWILVETKSKKAKLHEAIRKYHG